MEHKLKPFDKVLVRSGADGVWCADMFSHATKEFVWLTSHSCYSPSCVIPYEGNEHLLGTTDDPEPDFKFGDKVYVKWCGGVYKAVIVKANKDSKYNVVAAIEDGNEMIFHCSEIEHADW